jgi:AcrR family transcriptional regulator
LKDDHKTKGEKTASRILDAAEIAFADKGYDGVSLREVARQAGIREPGLYNYFRNKEHLYTAVLDRALQPLETVLQQHITEENQIKAFTDLPLLMTDLLLEHPRMAVLFQRALQDECEGRGVELATAWLQRLFSLGMETLEVVGHDGVDPADMAVQVIAMFNLCCGYFLSQKAFALMADGDILAPENIQRQKTLLRSMVRMSLV